MSPALSFQKEKREGLKPTCLWVSALGSTWDGFGSLGSKGIGGGPWGTSQQGSGWVLSKGGIMNVVRS